MAAALLVLKASPPFLRLRQWSFVANAAIRRSPATQDKGTATECPLKCCQSITYSPPHPFFPHKQEYFKF
jgi:hypothetical protein